MKAFFKWILTGIWMLVALIPAGGAAPVKMKTIVIDAGHGGHDSGCVSKDGKTTEKFLTFDIAQKFAERVRQTWPDLQVLMTRDDDTYVTLSGRADVAHDAGADLFISIHINAAASGSSANGYSVHCLGQSSKAGNDLFSKNLDLCKRENSVIKLEDDYETKYQGFDPSDTQSYIFFSLLQNSNLNLSLAFADDVNAAMAKGPVRHSRGVSQDPFWVLWRTAMPAVLIECAFISNPEDLKTLRSDEDRGKIADCLLNALRAYKTRFEQSTQTGTDVPAVQPEEPRREVTAPADSILYGTQVIATPKELSPDDKFFKGYTPVAIRGGKWIKYLVGTSTDLETARKESEKIRKIFTDSFMVKVKNNEITRIQ